MRITVTIPQQANRKAACYTLDCDEDARVMQVLHTIHEELDPGLAFRTNFCKRGSCGLCMVLVNKKAVKACSAPVQETMLIEPLPYPLVRDLVVVMDDGPGKPPGALTREQAMPRTTATKRSQA